VIVLRNGYSRKHNTGNEIHFLEPWYPLSKTDTGFTSKLNKVISKKHVLFGKKANVILILKCSIHNVSSIPIIAKVQK